MCFSKHFCAIMLELTWRLSRCTEARHCALYDSVSPALLQGALRQRPLQVPVRVTRMQHWLPGRHAKRTCRCQPSISTALPAERSRLTAAVLAISLLLQPLQLSAALAMDGGMSAEIVAIEEIPKVNTNKQV